MAAGVKTRPALPATRLLAAITAPAFTATPLRLRLPALGRLLISTALRLLPSWGSEKPKSAASRVRGASSLIVRLEEVALGASLTLVFRACTGSLAVVLMPSLAQR